MVYWCSITLIYITGVPERIEMSTSKKRLSITLQPEWEPVMDKLKKDKFYDKPYSNVIRHLIELGLKAVKH